MSGGSYYAELAGLVALPDAMEGTLLDFARKLRVTLGREQAEPSPDTALIGLLCDAARLGHENIQLGMGDVAEIVELGTRNHQLRARLVEQSVRLLELEISLGKLIEQSRAYLEEFGGRGESSDRYRLQISEAERVLRGEEPATESEEEPPPLCLCGHREDRHGRDIEGLPYCFDGCDCRGYNGEEPADV